MAAALISGALVWTLFVFGGAFPRGLAPAAAAIAVAALIVRPRPLRPRTRLFDSLLLFAAVYPLLQLIPLAPAWRDRLSPNASIVDEALRLDAGAAPARPITIDPEATLKAAAVAAVVLLLFWTARELFRQGGIRRSVRAVTWATLAVSVIAVLGRRWSSPFVYGVFDIGAAQVYGPFVNRNHMGTWLVMAVPLAIGYLFARLERHARDRGGMVGAIDAQTVWIVAAIAAGIAALIASLSRSATLGALGAGVTLSAVALSRRHLVMGRYFTPTAVIFTIAIGVMLPTTSDLMDRFEDSRTVATWARAEIWRETLPIVRDFSATGVGVGGYRMAMLLYQQADRRFFFNQAHNQYLQLAAEGGLLLCLPLAAAAVLFFREAAAREKRDHSAAFWIRAGGGAAVAGALVQSIWETGLRMPANALLFAVAAAIAVHARADDPD